MYAHATTTIRKLRNTLKKLQRILLLDHMTQGGRNIRLLIFVVMQT